MIFLKDDQPPINEFVNPLHGTEIKGDEKNDKENKGYVSNDSSVDVKWIEFKPDIEKVLLQKYLDFLVVFWMNFHNLLC